MAPDSKVRCESCGATMRVSFATCLRGGWPVCACNGYTMSLVSQPSVKTVNAAVDALFHPRASQPGEGGR